MRAIAIGLVLSQILCSTAVLAQSSGTRGGSGGTTGIANPPGAASGSVGTSAADTSSTGTAARSSDSGMTTGFGLLGTGDPVIDRQDRDLDRRIKSICKGC